MLGRSLGQRRPANRIIERFQRPRFPMWRMERPPSGSDRKNEALSVPHFYDLETSAVGGVSERRARWPP